MVKNSNANAGDTKTWAQSPSREDPLEEEVATQFSILAWRIPWTREPVRYSPWGHRESAMMRCVHMRMHACTHTHTHTHTETLTGSVVSRS